MKQFSVLKLALAVGTALGIGLAAAPAEAQATLDAVKKRGKILCGFRRVRGFSFADDKVCAAASTRTSAAPSRPRSSAIPKRSSPCR